MVANPKSNFKGGCSGPANSRLRGGKQGFVVGNSNHFGRAEGNNDDNILNASKSEHADGVDSGHLPDRKETLMSRSISGLVPRTSNRPIDEEAIGPCVRQATRRSHNGLDPRRLFPKKRSLISNTRKVLRLRISESKGAILVCVYINI